MGRSALIWLPVGLTVTMTTGILVSYGMALERGQIAALFPYISDTGAHVPEMFVFSFFFNLAAFLGFLTQCVRWRFVLDIVDECDPRARSLANFNIVMATFSSLGLLFVANFPESILKLVHDIGALIMFICGNIYAFTDTYLTHRMVPAGCKNPLGSIRLFICLSTLASLIIMLTTEGISIYQWNNSDIPLGDTEMLWNEDDPGYTAHLCSTFSEWIMAGFFLAYFLTYLYEFRRVAIIVGFHPVAVSAGASEHEPLCENTRLMASSSSMATFRSTLDTEPVK